MARKVFISFLGAGFYSDVIYQYKEFESTKTKFVQQSSLEFFGAKEWTPEDAGFIFVTEKAKKDNWVVESDSRFNSFKGENLPYEGLKKLIDKMELPFEVKPIDIPDGKDEDEIWDIFDIVFSRLEDKDQLYVDLTHGFRYLPMFMIVMGNYARFLKKAKICGLTYGNIEARIGDKAPIVNLLPLSVLQEWTFATANFLENGYTERLAELANEKLAVIRREQADKRADAGALGQFVKCLHDMTAERLMCRGVDVIQAKLAIKAQEKFAKLERVIIPPLGPVLKESLAFTNGMNPQSVSNMFVAAKWCLDHNLLQQAATFMEEGTISFFCERHNIPLQDRNRRELVTSAFSICVLGIPEEEQRVKPEYRNLLDEILNDDLLSEKEFLNAVSNLVDLRNDYNHCGMRPSANPPQKMRKALERLYPILSEKLFYEDTAKAQPTRQKFFLNLSNHPSTSWESSQLNAAQEFGTIEDMPFPAISPEATSEELMELAEKAMEEILLKARDADVTVHVMGEMTFTYYLVSLLKAKGITCVASTTERIIEEKDGMKTSLFKFVKFREY